MSTFPECPRCHNSNEGDSIWTCGDCGCVHCKECDATGGTCPECGSGNMHKAGTIEQEETSNDTSEDSVDQEGFSECPNCGKTDSGDSIWQCRDCDCIHCKDCDPDNGCCPNCGSHRVKQIGTID